MNPKQWRFVHEYCVDLNATQAAIRAGYSEATANEQGSRLLANVSIKEAIEERLDDIATVAGITAEKVLKLRWQIATADPNDLMQLRRVCCRYCYGFDHKYQWTQAEYFEAVNEAINKQHPAPDCIGGTGFDETLDPRPECPECNGKGVESMHINDTRHLKGSVRRLYAGVQKTKDGLKILTRDQDAALKVVEAYLGMNIERKEISGPGGTPISITNIKAEDLTDDQLAAIFKADDNP